MHPNGTGQQGEEMHRDSLARLNASYSPSPTDRSPASVLQEKADDDDRTNDFPVLHNASPHEEFKANQEASDSSLSSEAGRRRSIMSNYHQQESAQSNGPLYPSTALASAIARSSNTTSLAVPHTSSLAQVHPDTFQRTIPVAGGRSMLVSEPINFAIPSEQHPRLTGRPPISLYLSADYFSFSAYQLLVRRNVEFFEATHAEVESKARSRARPVVVGQVGIRCCFCKSLHPFIRASSATVYPTKKADVYQSAQNIVNAHWDQQCAFFPLEVRNELQATRGIRSGVRASKSMWADRTTALGGKAKKGG